VGLIAWYSDRASDMTVKSIDLYVFAVEAQTKLKPGISGEKITFLTILSRSGGVPGWQNPTKGPGLDLRAPPSRSVRSVSALETLGFFHDSHVFFHYAISHRR
jgi:hypothetical protein